MEETVVMSVAATQQSSPRKADQPTKKSKSKKHGADNLAQPSAGESLGTVSFVIWLVIGVCYVFVKNHFKIFSYALGLQERII